MQNNNIHIVHLGLSGFPFGSAPVNKSILILKALRYGHEEINVTIINSRAVHSQDIPVKLASQAEFEGLYYRYTTPSPYRYGSFMKRQISKAIGKVNEFFLLVSLRMKKQLDLAFLYLPDDSFCQLIYYRSLSKILGFPIIISWVEYFSEFPGRKKKFFKKTNDRLFDNNFMKYVDGVLPISEFFVGKLLASGKPILKIPALVDFDHYHNLVKKPGRYFLYCGSAGYSENLELVIDSFNLLNDREFELVLVVNGSSDQLKGVQEFIEGSPKGALIRHLMNLDYLELLDLYNNASALLIPLKNTVTDTARFPQKIAEYSAAGNPIITNPIGDVKIYFSDNENALFAKDYSAEAFAEKLEFVIKNPGKSEEIGKNGRQCGLKIFDYRNYSPGLNSMVQTLLK